MKQNKIRNIAIIAHVDHGKTTLVNQLLTCSGTFRDNEAVADRVMDSDPIERERGITILAKTTAINFGDYRINILDTPGHADFGGEVERIMHMVDGCLLLVDAFEGTMPQTRFVLKKAIEAHVKPIVVINKIDRPNANPEKVVDEVLELFIELGAPEDLLDFKVVYTSALKGTSSFSPDPLRQMPGMDPVFETIVEEIPAPDVNLEGNFQFQPALLDYNEFVGRIGIGRIQQGRVHLNDVVTCVRINGSTFNFRIQKLYGFFGLKRIEIEEAEAGEIIGIAGLPDLMVGETINSLNLPDPLPILRIDEPTLQMTFGTNSSPFAGRDGKLLTARKIEERLYREIQRDVSLRFERIINTESWIVSGRGELHLSILIENMRREGYELQVSKPKVIIKEIDGVTSEPYEETQIDVPNDYLGSVMEAMGSRGAELINMDTGENNTRLNYVIPSRGLLGFMTNFLTLTKGYGVINHTFLEYRPVVTNAIGERSIGTLVATDPGMATPYALQHIEERGVLFIEPGIEVYEGMIVGENRYDMDLAVNVTTTKNLTNQRSSNKDSTVVLKAPRKMTIEACLDYINSDELVEITPNSFRMRKLILNTVERKKYDARNRHSND
ncbi:MAG: translational GTPase TypA [Bacilli bacterium]|jgi:GTP-binding protein|nr:translational GTPase TypA [Bacilli bacterium]MCH4235607.1 translational GTPase TypA [Bacilli bacterium]